MPTTRRQFIKQGVGLATVGVVLPNIWLREAQAQTPSPGSRRILVLIQLEGGNDGLNTVIPFTDSNYLNARPRLAFREADLMNAQGSTIISNQFGLHPSMAGLKSLFDEGKVAVVLGVGYQNPNLSHFSSMDIWHTADPVLTDGLTRRGWLGHYADLALVGKNGVTAASIGGSSPRSLLADDVVIPNIGSFATYTFQTDARFTGDRNNQINTFNALHHRPLTGDPFFDSISKSGLGALEGAQQIQAAVTNYNSNVTYPQGNPLATALRMAAQLITTIPETNLLYVRMGGFDNHSQQIGNDKFSGAHAQLLRFFSDGVKAFYDDMAEHGLAERVLMLQWSEFGRRRDQNGSDGTDHGAASCQFVIGDPVVGGLYGVQPSLESSSLDRGGNPVYEVDFRAVYGTILDRWLEVDHREVLRGQFENVGFLG